MYVSLLWQLGNKSDIMTPCFSLPLPFVHNFSEIESTFQRCSGITRDCGWYLSKMLPICFRLLCHPCAYICFSTDFNKTISQKFQGFWAKRFGDAAKYCWFHNDSINLIKNTVEGNYFSVFLMMLPKHVPIDRNLQRKLKSSIPFILKNIFIYFLY